jgi:peptidoglycan/xylan/chitin deacetylase (PgdA/CDA1 family)
MSRARALARRLRAEWTVRSGAAARARARLDGTCAALLMYHRVLPRERAEARAVEPGMFVTPDTFERHLDWMAEAFRVLPLAEIVAALAAGRRLPSGACAITFDDGWADNAAYALPALAARGMPATVFLVTERVGTSGAFWPDEVCRRVAAAPTAAARRAAERFAPERGGDPSEALLAAFKALPEAERGEALDALRRELPLGGADDERELLTWGEVRAMAASGIAFESHGASHAILTGLPDAEARRELGAARERLREHGVGEAGLFAYPSGAWNARVRELVREAGHRAALATDSGLASAASDPFALPRIGLHDDVSASRAEFLRLVPGDALR